MISELELTPGLNTLLADEFATKIKIYQEVRNFANSVLEMVKVYYSALAVCILPVLFGLLGAEAYLLRSYEDQIRSRTLIAGSRHQARYLIAGIGGLVVGLFTAGEKISLSPCATAFLVGYAIDVFFTFIESGLQIFKRTPSTPVVQVPPARPSS